MTDQVSAPVPAWPTCNITDCIGIRVHAEQTCLAHMEPDVRKTTLAGLKPGADLDLRGVPFQAELLDQLLAAVRREDGSRVLGNVKFDEVQFSEDASFEEVRFDGDAGFGRAQFSGDVRFNEAQFSGDVRFNEAQFSGDGWFGRARFDGDAWFGRAQFSQAARFNEAQFSQNAIFDRAQISGAARFPETQFGGRALFLGTQFGGEAWFFGAQFREGVSFGQAQFTKADRLGPLAAFFLDLRNAVFTARLVLEASAARLSCVGARFEQGVEMRIRFADIALDGAVFAGSSSLVFVEVPLLPPPDYGRGGAIGQWSDRGGSLLDESALQQAGLSARPRLLSMRRVDVANLRIPADLDLSQCLLRDAYNLDKLRVDGPRQLASAPKRRGSTHRSALAEEHIWRQLRRPSQGWSPPSTEALSWIASQSDTPITSAPPSADLYRELRKAREDAKDEPGAADFYWGEMEMRRHDPTRPWAERFILWLYWLFSGYGLRAWRALLGLVVVIMGLAAVFYWAGFVEPPDPASYWTSVLYAARGTLSLTDNEVKLTAWGKLLQFILRLAGPVLLGLALLSIRNRVKR